jgi:hypothetical protein
MITRFIIRMIRTDTAIHTKARPGRRRLYLILSAVTVIFATWMADLPVTSGLPTAPASAPEKYSSFTAAIHKIGRKDATVIVSQPLMANEDIAVPPNVRIRVTGGGTINVAEGKTVLIAGPFEAPMDKVFDGRGRVRFAPSSTQFACPEWWGGDEGKESSLAIQMAIDSLSKGDVLLAEKTYLLNRRVEMKLIGSGDKVSAILVPRSGVNIVGRGYGSVLKVADNHTATGDYVVFAPSKAETTSDISFRNFRIDGNGSRNLVKGRIRRAMAIWLFAGRNISIDNVWFENQPGTNVVKFGSDSLSYLVTDSLIANCVFSNVGGAIPGNRGQRDHSTLYISGKNVRVSKNRLSNPGPYDENGPPVAVVAGIEMHGDDMTVSDNHVENYGNGGYIVGDGIVTAKRHRWTGNSFINMTKMGISIWSISPVGDILFEGNRIRLNGELDQCVAGVFQPLNPPDTTVGIDGITVRANVIDSTATKPGTVWCGIMFTAVRNAVIESNRIDRISGAAILIIGNTRKPLDCRNVTIRDNHLSDTSFNRYGAYPYAIDITNEGLGRFEDIRVTGNRIENTTPLAENMGGIGVKGRSPVARVRIEGGNRFVNLKQRDRHINYSGHEKNVTVGQDQD